MTRGEKISNVVITRNYFTFVSYSDILLIVQRYYTRCLSDSRGLLFYIIFNNISVKYNLVFVRNINTFFFFLIFYLSIRILCKLSRNFSYLRGNTFSSICQIHFSTIHRNPCPLFISKLFLFSL